MAGRPPYPLSAIVGQDDLVEALLVCAVHPVVGGVLIRGERGTAKSTAVRALAPILVASRLTPGPPQSGPAPPAQPRLGPPQSGPAPLAQPPLGPPQSGPPPLTQPPPEAPGSASGRLVELPLGATLDRLVGTLDVRAALAGEHRVEQGLLGRANGGLLYVDEVNLLPDHLVDAVLDAAASGVVTIERDGVSLVADARFLLVGTMNPEEGELRPQLLDRFGLGVEVTGPRDPATRARIVRRRMDFDAAPAAFAARWAASEHALASRIAAARRLISTVTIAERELLRITAVCAELDLDGVRGDLVCAHAACALAALDGLTEVDAVHVERAAHLALRHRLRRDPLSPPPAGGGRDPAIDDALRRSDGPAGTDQPDPPDPTPAGGPSDPPDPTPAGGPPARPDPTPLAASSQPTESPNPRLDDRRPGARPPFQTPTPRWLPDPDLAGPPRPPTGTRAGRPSGQTIPVALPSRLPESALVLRRRPVGDPRPTVFGRSPAGSLAQVDSRPARDGEEIAILASLLASLRGDPVPRTAIRGGRRAAVLCLVVDVSGSMAADRRLRRVKGALEAALRTAYARRDLVGVVTFSGDLARTLVEPGLPLEQAAARVRALPAGGRTPLAAGVDHAARLLDRLARGKLADRPRIAVLLTDGRAVDPHGHAVAALRRVVAAADRTVVVDLEDGPVRLGLAGDLAAATRADLTRLVAPADAAARRPGRSAAA
ncbi:MAG TPA: VWA domain-containing protein [Solirubrobacteraceae bacterium]|nr:VWA domain-containing protein [Solirubrobacteraceae bacterium]